MVAAGAQAERVLTGAWHMTEGSTKQDGEHSTGLDMFGGGLVDAGCCGWLRSLWALIDVSATGGPLLAEALSLSCWRPG
jgi:hypothetical protein